MMLKRAHVIVLALAIPHMCLAQERAIPWRGTVKAGTKTSTLEADDVTLRAKNKDLKNADGKYSIRVGANLKIQQMTQGASVHPEDPGCPHDGATFCAGLVEACCGNGQVLRACLGAWGCP
jgi:hypothetical protein